MEEADYVFPIDSPYDEVAIRFLESNGEKYKGYPLTFGLADRNKVRYAVTGDLWEIKPDKTVVVRILFYAFSGEQLINTPISHCFVEVKRPRIKRTIAANAVMAFCYAISIDVPAQSFRDAVYDYKTVISWEKNNEPYTSFV